MVVVVLPTPPFWFTIAIQTPDSMASKYIIVKVFGKNKIFHNFGEDSMTRLIISFGTIFAFIAIIATGSYAIGTSVSVIELPVTPNQWVTKSFTVDTLAPAIDLKLGYWTINHDGESVAEERPFNEPWIVMPRRVEKKSPSQKLIQVDYKVQISEEARLYMSRVTVSEAFPTTNGFSIGVLMAIPIYVWPNMLTVEKLQIKSVWYDPRMKSVRCDVYNPAIIHVRPLLVLKLQKKEGFWPFESNRNIFDGVFTLGWPILGKSPRIFSKELDLAPGKYTATFSSTTQEISGPVEFEFEVQ
jgi:hypothetical protein